MTSDFTVSASLSLVLPSFRFSSKSTAQESPPSCGLPKRPVQIFLIWSDGPSYDLRSNQFSLLKPGLPGILRASVDYHLSLTISLRLGISKATDTPCHARAPTFTMYGIHGLVRHDRHAMSPGRARILNPRGNV